MIKKNVKLLTSEVTLKVSALSRFACPIDGQLLSRSPTGYQCEKGHSFDQAREGYCNFLLVQNKKSIDPGDSKEMIIARNRFLNLGLYEPLAKATFALLKSIMLERNGPLRILDTGCGEGYYLDSMAKMAKSDPTPGSLELVGADISKWAIKAAARRSKEIAWVVASNRELPFFAGEFEVVLSMFGFPIWEQFSKLQLKNGSVILLDPGPNHLIEMRKIIYPKVNETQLTSLELAKESGYQLKKVEKILFQIDLKNKQEIKDLIAMTPHFFRASKEGRDALSELDLLSVTIDVSIRELHLNR